MPEKTIEELLDMQLKAAPIEAAKADITARDDYKETVILDEAITESSMGLSHGKRRPLVVEHTSAKSGKTVRTTITYMNPANDKGWGAIREIKEEVL